MAGRAIPTAGCAAICRGFLTVTGTRAKIRGVACDQTSCRYPGNQPFARRIMSNARKTTVATIAVVIFAALAEAMIVDELEKKLAEV